MSNEFVTGDTRTKLVQLKINDATFIIAPTDTVRAQIVSADKTKILTSAEVACLSTAAGAAWETSLVAVKFPRASTADIKIPGKSLSAFLEVQVTLDPLGEPEDFTFYLPITMIKGNLE